MPKVKKRNSASNGKVKIKFDVPLLNSLIKYIRCEYVSQSSLSQLRKFICFVDIDSYEYEDAIYQYHAEWLGRKSLDVYIPSLNTAIEYQGIQHYEPLEIFGGEENFKIQQQRDMEKKKLCAENGVRLIEWKYDIIPNLSNLKNLLKSNIVD